MSYGTIWNDLSYLWIDILEEKENEKNIWQKMADNFQM